MTRLIRTAFFLVLVIGLSGAGPVHRPAPRLVYDVVVYGGTSGGVIAAYTARMYGKTVLLVEPGRHLGGMSSGGLGQTDIGNKYAVTGLGLDFYRRLGAYYGRFEAWQFEPHVAEQVFEQYVDEAGVDVVFSRRLIGLEKAGAAIQSVTLGYSGPGKRPDDLVVSGRVFIDATYEGDLMAAAGVSYAVGREANETYGETNNGVFFPSINHQFPDGKPPKAVMDGTPEPGPPVDPYVVPGNPAGGLLPGITGDTVEPNGTGDRKVQAYNFRMCLCDDPDNRIPITRPERYDSTRYELLLRDMTANPPERLDKLFIISRMPNGKTDWNNKGAFSTDFIGGSWAYPEADAAGKSRIWLEHVDYQKGLIYFVGQDPRVPEHIRKEMAQWGYCRDEFLDTGGWPHQLYVREARRMIGEYVMTEHEALGTRVVPDAVGLAAYGIDSHNVQRLAIDGKTLNEGNVQVDVPSPYPIAYRALTPKRQEATNLLVPVALSATHAAYGSIRMEPVFMVLGQVAGLAASMSIDKNLPVQQVDIPALQAELRQNPLADGSTPEVLVDDRYTDQVQFAGSWATETPYGRYGPTVHRSTASGSSARFLVAIDRPGVYDVYLNTPRAEGMADRWSIQVRHLAGTEAVNLDMKPPDEGLQHNIVSWRPVGRFRFDAGKESWVEIRAASDGFLFADAVLFVPVR